MEAARQQAEAAARQRRAAEEAAYQQAAAAQVGRCCLHHSFHTQHDICNIAPLVHIFWACHHLTFVWSRIVHYVLEWCMTFVWCPARGIVRCRARDNLSVVGIRRRQQGRLSWRSSERRQRRQSACGRHSRGLPRRLLQGRRRGGACWRNSARLPSAPGLQPRRLAAGLHPFQHATAAWTPSGHSTATARMRPCLSSFISASISCGVPLDNVEGKPMHCCKMWQPG